MFKKILKKVFLKPSAAHINIIFGAVHIVKFRLLTIFAILTHLVLTDLFVVTMVEFIEHLINPQWILTHGGLWLLLMIVFAETGLFFGFFLPGDSLLFVTGMTISINNHISGMNIWEIALLIALAGILGDFVGYWFGRKSGPVLFRKKDSFLFKKRHLNAAHAFYKKYGGGAIFFARFLPIIRTFAPIVAGIVKMDFKKFTFFNIIGCVSWVFVMTFSGYYLGETIPGLENHLTLIVIVMVLITTVPVIIKLFTQKRKNSKKTLS